MKKLILIFALIINLSAFSQDEKTVTLVVSGQGKTQDEAKQNALRSAIEQAFGTFISSKTEILNDSLVKDEIVSIANGNIQKFDIISEEQIPDGEYVATLKATVSVTKLTSFVESKGVEVEFKGGLFSLNIKQQLLNEKSEINAIIEMIGVLHKSMQLSFDYEIWSGEPQSTDDESKNWSIPLQVKSSGNKNIDFCANYFRKTLSGISLTSEEVASYKSLNKKIFSITVNYNNQSEVYYLRKKYSVFSIISLIYNWNFYTRLFSVNNGIDESYGMGNYDDKIFNFSDICYRDGFNPNCFKGDPSHPEINWEEYYTNISINFPSSGINKYHLYFSHIGTFNWNDKRVLSDIEKITGYSVKPRGVVSDFKNGGYVVYEKDGHGLIMSPFDIGTFSWDDAKKACEELDLSNYKDWRLPSIKELELIYKNVFNFSSFVGKNKRGYDEDHKMNIGDINKVLPYWSSDSKGLNETLYFYFGEGGGNFKGESIGIGFHKYTPYNVRAVRSF
jgi:hypothetical protein